MLSSTTGSVTFATQFTQEITVFSEEVDSITGETVQVPSTTVPVVTASFTDPGVTITPEIGKVTISGMYREIIVTNWQYISTSGAIITSPSVPTIGTFKKILKVDSPTRMSETCTYSINSENYVHTVTLSSYTEIADALKSLLAAVP